MKNLMNIGEAARQVGVHPETLRLYEKEGIISPARLPNGHRIFTAQDVAKARQVHERRENRGNR